MDERCFERNINNSKSLSINMMLVVIGCLTSRCQLPAPCTVACQRFDAVVQKKLFHELLWLCLFKSLHYAKCQKKGAIGLDCVRSRSSVGGLPSVSRKNNGLIVFDTVALLCQDLVMALTV